MRIYVKTIGAMALILLCNYCIATYTMRLHIPQEAMEVFFGVFGVVYAIIIGFALFEVLKNYNEIKHCMNAEVNELQDLRDYLVYVDNQDEVKQEIRVKIKNYVQSVVDREWPDMCASRELDMDTPDEIFEIMKSVNKIRPTNESDLIALGRLIETIGKITTYRTTRITASVERLPSLLMQLIFILSLFIIGSFALIPFEPLLLELLLTALSSFGIVFIFFVIQDLDYPFGGIWSIEPVPYRKFLEKFEQKSK